MKKEIYIATLSCLSAAMLSGCVNSASYYHITSSSSLTNPEDLISQHEVTAAPDLSDKIGDYKRIVVSAPQYVAQQTSNGATVMKDDTSYWLSEIERQFLSNGYTVLSRQKFEELRREETVRSDEKAADLLGADLIVQINNLSFDIIDLESHVDRQITCFRSDSSSEQGTKLPEGYEHRLPSSKIEPALKAATQDIPKKIAIAELNAKIIDAKTGEIVYFYKDTYSTLKSLDLYSVTIVLKNWGDPITGYKWKVMSSDKKSKSYSINNDITNNVSSGDSLMKIATSRFISSFIDAQNGTEESKR